MRQGPSGRDSEHESHGNEAKLLEAKRAELQRACRPSYDGPQPLGVDILGWAMTGLSLLGAAVSLVFLALAVVGLFRHAPLAGERLFGWGVGLAYFVFVARVWYGFRALPDWRVALDVPLGTKAYAAAGSAAAASLAAGAVALVTFSICAKTTFLGLMDAVGAGGVGKVQVIFSALGLFFYFALLWHLFGSLLELRESARTVLWLVLGVSVVVALGGIVADQLALGAALGNHGVTAVCVFAGCLALAAFVLELAFAGERVAEKFREHEP